MTSGSQYLDKANRYKKASEKGETQASIAKREGVSPSDISAALRVLDLPESYHKMLRAEKMQIQAATKFVTIPAGLQERSLDLAIQFRALDDAASDYNKAQLQPPQKGTKVRRSPKGKIRFEEAEMVVAFLKGRGVEVRSW